MDLFFRDETPESPLEQLSFADVGLLDAEIIWNNERYRRLNMGEMTRISHMIKNGIYDEYSCKNVIEVSQQLWIKVNPVL